MKRNKILIIVPSLKAGGAERVLSFLSKEVDKVKFDVLLVVVGFEKDATYETGPNVVFLKEERLLFAIPKLVNAIFRFKPRIIVGSIVHVNIFLGLLKVFLRGKKIVIREASVISKMSKYTSHRLIFNPNLIRWIYGKADMIICQSYDMYNDFRNHYGIQGKRLTVINNPITQANSSTKKTFVKKNVPPVKFITIGRLSEEKGHIRILNQLAKITFEFEYTIIGEGPLKDSIFEIVHRFGLSDKVKYIPHTHDVIGQLENHHLFLQGSFVEGFPNSLLESCVSGTPVLAYSAPGGTNEIIEEAVNGYMVDDDEAYFRILNNPDAYVHLDRLKIIESVDVKFSPERILSQYERLFEEI
ncbi:glycosyltransferase [Pedobacter africanus]|nr:glycosyltransferase [Pedobacter africanus]